MAKGKDPRDFTGKSGAGKRYLDEYGNFRPISDLPQQTQDEIKLNSRKIQEDTVKKRLAQSAGVDEKFIAQAPNVETESLLRIIENQSSIIDRLEGKMDSLLPQPVKEEEAELKLPELTPKEKLLWEAEELGLAVDASMTIKALKAAIAEEVSNDDDL
jgi:hypothetical protein